MSTSGPEDKSDEDDAATVAADERNDNEAARDAAATVVFRHQAKEDDYALRPQWADDLKKPVITHDRRRRDGWEERR